MPYRVELAPAAQRDLRRLNPEVIGRLSGVIQSLADTPRPVNSRKIRGQDHAWRVRMGRYRIIYDVYDDRSLVLVLKVDLRRESTYRL